MTDSSTSENARQAALDYHEFPKPGKLEIRATKPMANQRDLSRAYSPGVAEACLEIKADPQAAARYTAKGNLVAVVSNGSAVLGLGNIGALAGKPVMEGKAVLFKKFANIDCFDIEVDESDPVKLAEIVGEPRADLRRDQPRGHQGARVLRGRAALPREDEDPGVPRRPARHGHRRRRRGDQRAARGEEEDRGRQDRLDRRGRRRHRLPQHADQARRETREHLPLRPPGRDLRGPRRRHGAGEGRLRPEDRCPDRGRRHPRRRSLPRPFGAGGADRRDGQGDGARPDRARARQPQPGDHARGGARGQSGRDHRHRPLRLSQPGQQRPLLPVHLPRRARRGRDRDQRRHGDRLCRGNRGAGPRLLLGGSCGGLPGRAAFLRSRLPDSQGIRPAAPRHRRKRSGRGGDENRRRHPPGRRLRRVPGRAQPVGLPLRLHHAPGLRGGAQRRPAHRLRRGRGRAGAACGASRSTRRESGDRSSSGGRR